jgi:hypothetical protein
VVFCSIALIIKSILIAYHLYHQIVVVLVGGAYLFQVLEQHASIVACQEAANLQADARENLTSFIFNYVMLNAIDWQDRKAYSKVDTSGGPALLYASVNETLSFYAAYNNDISVKLLEYRKLIVKQAVDRASRYTGQDCTETSFWVTENSLLFVVSILATIGYGQIYVSLFF